MSGAIPVRALLVGRLNQHDNMGDDDMTQHKEEVYSMLRGACDVRVYRDLDNGHYVVVRNKDEEELAVFSFAGGTRGSLTRERAENFAKEYANGYVTGFNDALEGT